MTSLIPKIKVSNKKRSEKIDLTFDNSTTLGFGHVQPTMCREMVPGSKFKVKVGSFVRLSPLVLPTFGRMSLVHKHVFVPISAIWEPFNSFLAGQPYKQSSGTTVVNEVWQSTPTFQMSKVVQYILTNWSDITIYTKNDDGEYEPLTMKPVDITNQTDFGSIDYNTENSVPAISGQFDMDAWNAAADLVYAEGRSKLDNGDFGTPADSAEAIAAYSAWLQEHMPSITDYYSSQQVGWNTSPGSSGSISYPVSNASGISGFDPDISGIQQAWTDLVVGNSDLFGTLNSTSLFNAATASNPTGIANDGFGTILLGGYYIEASKTSTLLSIRTKANLVGNVVPVGSSQDGTIPAAELGIVDYKDCDYFTEITVSGRSYGIAFKLKPAGKRLRAIFVGLGYQFSPFNTLTFNPFKLVAFYKSWFELFRPKREYAFSETACYNLISLMRTIGNSDLTGTGMIGHFNAFINELSECYYYLPQDYFGMSVTRPIDDYRGTRPGSVDGLPIRLNSYDGSVVQSNQTYPPSDDNIVSARGGDIGTSPKKDAVTIPVDSTNGYLSAAAVRIGLKLLKYANKNTIVGRSVYDYLKAHFGISVDDADGTGQIIFIGDDDIQIQISDVMSTSETAQGSLGEYAGKGIGYGNTREYDFTAKEFGYWITFSTIVPKSGYFQGYLLENRHSSRYDFFHPEFDALGYQILERGELMDDYTHKFAGFNPVEGNAFSRKAGFGFVPRYSEYKVGRNIVNGDLSLNSMDASMAAYYLDRKFPRFDTGAFSYEDSDQVVRQAFELWRPSFIPSVVFDNFRRIDPSDKLGDYGRIFRYDAVTVDPFIIHSIFSVDAYLPAKSLSDSFDTTEEDETNVTEITHS